MEPTVDAEVPARRAALLLFVTGFVAISLEVLWTRALEQVLSGTVYSFATVLAVFLLGIALGSWVYRKLLRRIPPLRAFVAAEVLLANYVLLSLSLIYFIPGVSSRLGALLGVGFVRGGVILESLLSAFILLLPAVVMGVLFPLLLDAARDARRPHNVGLLVAANPVGSVLGPLVAGFLLLPRLGLQTSLVLTAAICLALAAAVTIFNASRVKASPPRRCGEDVSEGAGGQPRLAGGRGGAGDGTAFGGRRRRCPLTRAPEGARLRSSTSSWMRFQPPGGGRIGRESQHRLTRHHGRVSRCCGNGASGPEPAHRGSCRAAPAPVPRWHRLARRRCRNRRWSCPDAPH